ncbi:MAG: hypothetical protein ACJASX_002110 [Limisphaerales bacterium]
MHELLLHLVGDYLLQTEQMALRKVKSWFWAILHALVYSLPFLLIINAGTIGWLTIFITHAFIDRYRLANYVCRFKNVFWFGPRRPECDPETGYAKETPDHVKFWLVVIIDNACHLIINHLALKFLNISIL